MFVVVPNTSDEPSPSSDVNDNVDALDIFINIFQYRFDSSLLLRIFSELAFSTPPTT